MVLRAWLSAMSLQAASPPFCEPQKSSSMFTIVSTTSGTSHAEFQSQQSMIPTVEL